MAKVPTPHNAANKEDIAKVVLMPGDPVRSKWIAETFLDDPRLVNNIRGVQGYTGTWQDTLITVMASGMGIPSISIYAYELYNFYDVDVIIRTGTCGSIQPDVNIFDVVLAKYAYTNSSFLDQFALPKDYVPVADKETLMKAEEAAKYIFENDPKGYTWHVGAVLTEEIYYSCEENIVERWAAQGVLAFEMEAAALYANASQAGKKAAAIFTVSNNILTGREMDPSLREHALTQMAEIALRTAVSIRKDR